LSLVYPESREIKFLKRRKTPRQAGMLPCLHATISLASGHYSQAFAAMVDFSNRVVRYQPPVPGNRQPQLFTCSLRPTFQSSILGGFAYAPRHLHELTADRGLMFGNNTDVMQLMRLRLSVRPQLPFCKASSDPYRNGEMTTPGSILCKIADNTLNSLAGAWRSQ
jgi:hypothetical protein